MKMVLSQALTSLKKSFIITILIILIFAGSAFLLGGVAGYYADSSSLRDTFEGAYGKDSSRIFLGIAGRGRPSIFDTPEHYDQFISTVEDVVADFPGAQIFPFLNYQIAVENFSGSDSLLRGFDTGDAVKNIFSINENVGPHSTLLSLSVRQGFLDQFNLNVSEGEGFTDYNGGVFSYSPDAEYPIILGSAFRKDFRLGDTLSVIFDDFNGLVNDCRVVGFLAEGSAILNVNNVQPTEDENSEDTFVYLDNYIVLPEIDFSRALQTAGIPLTMKYDSISSTYNGQFIITWDKAPRELETALKNTMLDKGYIGVTAWNVMHFPASMQAEMDEYFNILMFSAVFIAATSVVCISASISDKINTNLKKYAVHLVSGAKLSTVRGFAIAEVLIITLAANIVAAVLLVTLGSSIFSFKLASLYSTTVNLSWLSVAVIFALDIAVVAMSLAYPMHKINNTEYDTLLRGNE